MRQHVRWGFSDLGYLAGHFSGTACFACACFAAERVDAASVVPASVGCA